MTKVKVYSTPTCPWCKKTKKFLKDNNIEFEDHNVAENTEAREEMVEKSGQLGVPVVEINNNIIVGFDKEAIQKEIEKLEDV